MLLLDFRLEDEEYLECFMQTNKTNIKRCAIASYLNRNKKALLNSASFLPAELVYHVQ